ncbi:unnamed protein product [Blepharisma stoltei]|uniref:Uncharacterized protein n=1 Tax=Blepharisma stoltei TaxID=1481888 RepID=A0AAU9KD50_9CILI|nr:unnamed protein product [Blepharisma stoltei]
MQSVAPLINALKELYYLVKRNVGRNLRSNPVKLAKKAKRIDLNNLNTLFDDEIPSFVRENQNLAYTDTQSQDLSVE